MLPLCMKIDIHCDICDITVTVHIPPCVVYIGMDVKQSDH